MRVALLVALVLHAGRSAHALTATAGRSALLSRDEVSAIATRNGFALELTAPLGAFKATLRDRGGRLLGESYGLAQPNGILHWDSIQVRQFSDYYARRAALRRGGASAGASREEGTPPPNKLLGLPTALLAAAVLAWARESAPFSPHTAQILAINDSEAQHRRLVRFYRICGLKAKREVGDDLRSIPDRLAYGGCGTIMEVAVDVALRKCTDMLRVEGASAGDGAQAD